MAPIAYTRFPRLLANELVGGRIEYAPQEVTRVEGSENEALRAWANILQSYTGKDDRVVFLVDDGSVTVSPKDGSIKKELGNDGDSEEAPQDATGVFTSKVSNRD
jgi:hypothetical protein